MTIEEMKERKKQKGFSCEQIADWSGVPLGTVQKIFSGVTQAPRFATLQALERVFREHEPKNVSYDFRDAERYGSFRVEESIMPYLAGKKQGEYTLKEYYALPQERRVELIDGVFYDMGAPSFVHQGIGGELYRQIANFIRANKGKCAARMAPVDVRLDCDDRTMVQPDVLIVCDRDKLMRWGVMGAPDFVAEVLSPSTGRKDTLKKLSKYMEAGVKEYWIIDPDKKKLIIYHFEDEEMLMPVVRGLTGKAAIGIYQGQLEIDLDMIAEMIEDYPDGERD